MFNERFTLHCPEVLKAMASILSVDSYIPHYYRRLMASVTVSALVQLNVLCSRIERSIKVEASVVSAVLSNALCLPSL